MISKTYVNEVDVRKIRVGQIVEIGLDAFPEKSLKGKVIKVANVGEQRPNSDAKVFQVNIQIDGTDPLLRPSMTTSNKIIISKQDSVTYVPLECLHSKDDSISYVYVREGISLRKQEVQVGETNMNEAIILNGIEEGDRLFLSVPTGQEDKAIDLLPEMEGKRNIKKEEEVKEEPAEKTITLPDGRVITIPADGQRGGGMRRGGGTRPSN
jgi:hypothetical protein